MLKKRLSIIAFLMVVIIALSLPIVKAEDMQDTNDDDSAVVQEEQVTTTNEGEAVTTTQGEEEVGTTENSGETETQEQVEYKQQDVYLTGDNVTIDYIVDGNVFVAANNVTINSQIGGDVFVVANTVTVGEQGYIFSNLFAVADSININGVVYDMYSMSNTMQISGYVYRDVKAIANKIDIAGVVGRNAFVDCSNINFIETKTEEEGESTVTSQGRIVGNLNYTASQEITFPEGVIGGETSFTSEIGNGAQIQDYIMYAGRFVVTVIILWLLGLWLAPKFTKNSGEILAKRTGAVIGYGILTPIVLLIVPILLLLVNVTSNIGVIGVAVLFLLIMIGSPIFVITLNKLICDKLKIEKNIGIFGVLIISSVIFWLLGLIPILGTLIIYISAIFGIGTIVANLLPKKEKKDAVEVEKVDDKKEEK